MIVSNFNSTKPINIVFLSIILSVLYFSTLIISNLPFFSIIGLVKFLLVLSTFFLFITKKVNSSENDFGALFYVLISGLFFASFINITTILSNFILLIALNQIYSIENSEIHIKEKLFNFGFLIAIATQIFSFSIFFLFLGFVAVLVFNKLNWRNLIIPIIGFLVPFFFIYISNDLFKTEFTIINYPNLQFMFNPSSLLVKLIGVYIILLLLWSLFKISTHLNFDLVFYKNYHALIVIHLIIAVLIVLFSINKDASSILFLVYPLSVLFANGMLLIKKKWLADLVLLVGIILIIANYKSGL